MSRRHKISKPIFTGMRQAPARSKVDLRPGKQKIEIRHGDNAPAHVEDCRKLSPVQLAHLADIAGACVVRHGSDGSYTAGHAQLTIRMPYTSALRCGKRSRRLLEYLGRVFPGLHFRMQDSAPERAGQIRIAKRFLPDGKTGIPIVRPAGMGSTWFNVSGSITPTVLDVLDSLVADGQIAEMRENWTQPGTGTNAYVPKPLALRVKERAENRRALAIRIEQGQKQFAAGMLPTMGAAHDTLRDGTPRIARGAIGSPTSESSLRLARSESGGPETTFGGPDASKLGLLASPVHNEHACYVRRTYCTRPRVHHKPLA